MRRYLDHLGRLACFCAISFGILLYVDYRVARATVMEGLAGFGTRMVPYLDDHRTTEGPRTFRLNGIELHMAVGHSAHPPRFVRDWYLDRYAPKGPQMEAFRASLKKQGMLDKTIPNANQLVTGDDENGTVSSIDVGEVASKEELLARVKRVMIEHDLGKVGQLRYLMFNKEAAGTRFLTVWSDNTVKLDQLIALGDKDAEGFDIPNVPRYPGMKRILSAAEVGMPQASAIYEGPGQIDNAVAFYRARLRSNGFHEDHAFHDQMERDHGSHSLRFTRNDEELLVDVSPSSVGVMVAIIQTR
jgi:hypothetical protein